MAQDGRFRIIVNLRLIFYEGGFHHAEEDHRDTGQTTQLRKEQLGVDSLFIVIECGTYDELINDVMEDADPFPYDLTEDELLSEVKYILGIEPYPTDY